MKAKNKPTEIEPETSLSSLLEALRATYSALMNETSVGVRSREKRMAALALDSAPSTRTTLPEFTRSAQAQIGAQVTVTTESGATFKAQITAFSSQQMLECIILRAPIKDTDIKA